MSSEADDEAPTRATALDDLAFMRSLVQPGGGSQQMMFGEAYFAAGLVYGLQCLGHAAQSAGWLPGDGWFGPTLGVGPTLIFMVLITVIAIRRRRAQPGGLVARAVSVTFGALGMANLALIVIIGSVAMRMHSLAVWMIYPCVVFLMQGVAWVVAYALRKRLWLLVVGAGWVVAAIALSQMIESPALPLLFAVALFALMVVPGAVVMRLARQGR